MGVRVLDLSKVGNKDDLWILANRAAQFFYAEQILSKNEKYRQAKAYSFSKKATSCRS